MKGAFEAFKSSSEVVEERQRIQVKELLGVPFTIDAIRIKEDMNTKFGPMDTAIMDINVNDTPCVCFVTNKLVYEKLEYLHDELIDYSQSEFTIEKRTSKAGNVYYDIVEL